MTVLSQTLPAPRHLLPPFPSKLNKWTIYTYPHTHIFTLCLKNYRICCYSFSPFPTDICRYCARCHVMDHACYGGCVYIWRSECPHHDIFQVITKLLLGIMTLCKQSNDVVCLWWKYQCTLMQLSWINLVSIGGFWYKQCLLFEFNKHSVKLFTSDGTTVQKVKARNMISELQTVITKDSVLYALTFLFVECALLEQDMVISLSCFLISTSRGLHQPQH